MSWLSALFGRNAQEQKLDSELRFHLEQQLRDNLSAGMSPEEASRQVGVEFGGLEQIKEQCREMRTGRWIETILQDLKFGLRTLRRTPGFTAAALGTLALGIGANAAIFSFIDGVFLKRIPYPEPDRIVRLLEIPGNGGRNRTSPLSYLDWAKQNTVFETIAAQTADGETTSLTGIETPVQLSYERVSAHFFDVFRIRPALGRTFVEGEDQPGRDNVVVLNHAFWASQFGSDPGIIGRTIILDGKPNTVIGVMPPGVLDRSQVKLWRPLGFVASDLVRDYHWLAAFALLKPGVTLAQAQAEMNTIALRIAHDYPASNKDHGIAVDSFGATVVGSNLRQSLYVLMAAVGLVLLIACANLANLTLARGIAREREVAIRAALGAGRWRLVQQFLTESLLLSSAGGAAGLLVAYGGMAVLKSTHAFSLPATADVTLDGKVVLFTLGLTLLSGLIFGLIPAFKASRPDLTHPIKESGPGANMGHSARSLRGALIITEVALAFVLLSGAGLLIRSFFQLLNVDPGFDSTNVVTAYLPISDHRFASAIECNLYLHQIVDGLGALPGVSDVALTEGLPLEGGGNGMPFQVVGAKTIDVASRPACFFKPVTPSYFRAVGMRLARGRLLSDHDQKGTAPVAVINETMAKRYFPSEDPVGKYISVQEIPFAKAQLGPEIPWEVVGVVRNEKTDGFGHASGENPPGMYVSEEQSLQTWQYLVVRGAMDPAILQRSIRHAVRGIDRDQVLDRMRTLEQIKSDAVGSDRVRSSLLAIFAVAALLLAGMGLYGVISYSVTQRTREIGIRTALGATSANILGLVLRSGMQLTGVGLIVGIGGALGLSQFLASMLFGVEKYDPPTFMAVGGILFITALLACYLPARRAIKINPIVALRCD